jgi:type VI secretion system protein ImpA
MPDIAGDNSALPPPVDLWLLPVDGERPCGLDLEYDDESLALREATGKPDNQFGPGEPANWARVREVAESLFTRTRDLRVALWWGRARLNLDGLAALPAVLALLHGLLDRFWDDLHPLPDAEDGDAQARLSVIGGLANLSSLLGDIRNSKLSSDRRLDGLRIRDVEVALSKLAPIANESLRTQGQISAMLAEAADAGELRGQTEAALSSLQQIQELMEQRFRPDLIVDLTTVRGMLASVKTVLPAAVESGPAGETRPAEGVAAAPPAAGGVHSVASRQEAIRAIELVCAYLERSEPSNPAQLLLRRAAGMIDKNFLQLVRELAPDAVKEVARIMGVDPSTISDQN